MQHGSAADIVYIKYSSADGQYNIAITFCSIHLEAPDLNFLALILTPRASSTSPQLMKIGQ
jgi:hypothetical protein